ncbi:hypothetical protein Ssi02_20440 [Sinosporangium siamense]|uniref:DUF2399 domain-containing protein n=2 Tax=Sinosporangium siamense TaxID=1367973 RepID=A0A919RDC6_9ACTN|nr:hypothetical protein Ssi02_20440 [Sinosporangium siamense]
MVAVEAGELGPRCPPNARVNGRPSAAVWRLLDLLGAGGAEFAYHGDFEWGGIGIANAVRARVGWVPWRYDSASCQAVAASAPLPGRVEETPWAWQLSAAMVRQGVGAEEELVIADLLGDLAAGRRP